LQHHTTFRFSFGDNPLMALFKSGAHVGLCYTRDRISMVDPVRRMGRRQFTRVGLLLGFPLIFCGCGGDNNVTPTGAPVEKGGRDRLKLMETGNIKAAEKASKKKR
jgi:hypothetical protein